MRFGVPVIRKDEIEPRFLELLKRSGLKSEVDPLISVVFDRVWGEEVKLFEEKQSIRQKTKEELKEKVKQLTELVIKAKSESLRHAYETQIETVTQELEALGNATGTEIDFSIPYRTAFDKALGLLKNPHSIWESLNVHEQHQLFFFIYEQKLPYAKGEGYRTNEISRVATLFEEFATQKPLIVVFV